MSKNKTYQSFQPWLVCFAAALFFFFEFIQMEIFNTINDQVRAVFNLDASQLSFLSSSFLIGNVLFLLPAGILLDRYSVRKIMVITMSICLLGTLGFALSNNVWLSVFFRFITGCANSFCFIACMLLVSRWFPPARQGLVVGLVITLAFLGGLSAQAPMAQLMLTFGWRNALLYNAISGLFILLLIIIFVKNHPRGYQVNEANQNLKRNFFDDLKKVIKDKQNWFAGLYASLLNLPIMVMGGLWGSSYLIRVHNLNKIDAATLIEQIFIGSIFGCPIAGWISDRLARRKLPMIIGALFSIFFMLALIILNDLNYLGISILLFAIGFFTSTQVIVYPLITESNPTSLTGTAMGFASIIIMGGGALSQVLFSELLDWNWHDVIDSGKRIYTATDFHTAMLMFPIAMLVALIISFITKETHCKFKS